MTKVSITNIVATASVNQEVDFCELRKSKEIFHDSNTYGGRVAYFKKDGMQGKVSIFLSGKMISIGTKSEKNAFKELEMAKDFLIKKALIKKTIIKPIVQNIVLCADFEKTIDIERLSESISSIYEPEQFSGLILKLSQPFKTSVLIFASGKIVVAGLKNSEQIDIIMEEIKQTLESNLPA
jgi:TATA-box binding protein (TBP) (component of TFIID and TFIIIB)